jgi:hypothetical protein
MKTSLKVIMSSLLAIAICCLPLSTVFAKSGCCSKHGGVVGCDNASGNLKCKDNSISKTCTCQGTTTKPAKTTTKAATTTNAAAAAPVAATTKSSTKAPKGCCSKHGGVKSCNTQSGYYMCKDGTQSTTCTCH